MLKTLINHNQQIVNQIIEDWNCTELEAWASMELNTDSLEETQKAIAIAVTHDRLLVSLLPETIQFLRNEYYRYKNVPDDYILLEAREMVKEQAYMFSFQWGQSDDYEDMTEDEKRIAVFGND